MVAYAIKDAHKADIGVRTLAIRFSTGASAKWLSEPAEDVTRWLRALSALCELDSIERESTLQYSKKALDSGTLDLGLGSSGSAQQVICNTFYPRAYPSSLAGIVGSTR